MHLFSRTCLVATLTSVFSFSAASADSGASNNSHANQSKPNKLIHVETNQQTKARLVEQLQAITFFSADFVQKVFDNDNNLIQQGTGTMVVSKPNKVHWQTNEPEESLIVSDGTTLWFYDPFIEQVSAFSLDNAVANTPILLLTNESDDVWDDYDVSSVNTGANINADTSTNDATFTIISQSAQSQIQSLTVSFSQPEKDSNSTLPALTNRSEITTIIIHDITGQRSEIQLSDSDYINAPDASLFKFNLPEGVFLDDQR